MDDNERTQIGTDGLAPAMNLAPEAEAAQDLHSRVEQAKALIRKGLGTSLILDAVRDRHFREALALLSDIATE